MSIVIDRPYLQTLTPYANTGGEFLAGYNAFDFIQVDVGGSIYEGDYENYIKNVAGRIGIAVCIDGTKQYYRLAENKNGNSAIELVNTGINEYSMVYRTESDWCGGIVDKVHAKAGDVIWCWVYFYAGSAIYEEAAAAQVYVQHRVNVIDDGQQINFTDSDIQQYRDDPYSFELDSVLDTFFITNDTTIAKIIIGTEEFNFNDLDATLFLGNAALNLQLTGESYDPGNQFGDVDLIP